MIVLVFEQFSQTVSHVGLCFPVSDATSYVTADQSVTRSAIVCRQV